MSFCSEINEKRETEQLKIEVVKLEEQIKKEEPANIDSPAEEMIKVMQKLRAADGRLQRKLNFNFLTEFSI